MKRWLIGIVVLAVVLVVGGPFVYIHYIEGKAPAPLSIDATTTSTSASGATTPATTALDSVDGTFKIASGSQAGYRVKENLFGQSATAVGRTSAVTGSFTIRGTTVTKASFTVDMTKVTSDRSQRDDQFQGRIMDTADFPLATFVLTKPIALGSVPADGVVIHPKATGKLTLHGVAKTVTFDLDAKRSGGAIDVSSSMVITFADYNVDNPSGGPASVGDSGTLEFLLVLSKS
jgi:polyisoprenoid-binding protein YceI